MLKIKNNVAHIKKNDGNDNKNRFNGSKTTFPRNKAELNAFAENYHKKKVSFKIKNTSKEINNLEAFNHNDTLESENISYIAANIYNSSEEEAEA